MKKRTLSLMLMVVMALPGWCNDNDIKNIDLPAMYAQIDEAIDKSPFYINDYEKKIRETQRALAQTTDIAERLMQTMELSKMYESFNGDSSMVYTARALHLARQHGFVEMQGECMARMAYLCTFLGSQTEALTLLGRINAARLTQQARCTYYRAYMMVFSNLSANTQLSELREEFNKKYEQYMDSLLSTATPGSEMDYGHRQPMLMAEGKLDEALKMNDERLNMTQEGTHDNAIVSYSRYTIYQQMGNREMAKYWLCKSALDDVRNAVMDQMSLISLAAMLEDDGDTDRANRYISFTWECNRRYSPRMRSWQIAPLLSAIEQNYQAKLDRKSHIMTVCVTAGSAVILLLFFLLLISEYRRRRLQKKNAQLKESHQHQQEVNEKLEWVNEQLKRYNAELSQEVKERQEQAESHE